MDAIPDARPGDVVACWGADFASRLVSLATSSLLAPRGLRFAPSHVAILCESSDPHIHEPLWIESTTLCGHRCEIRRAHVRGVQAHRIENRLQDYWAAGGRAELYRLTEIDELTDGESESLTALSEWCLARNLSYDLAGALISGTRALRFTRCLQRDLERVFCSELIAAILQRLCRMNREDPTRFHPGRLLRRLVKQGTYRRVGEIERIPETV
jgi:hypothetical protein